MLSKTRIAEIAQHFETSARYRFNNHALLIQALTRPSAKGRGVAKDASDFESLEFLGDRVLNLAIAEHLIALYPTASPNELHKHYESFIRNTDDRKRNGGPLYRVSKTIQLESYILKASDEDLEEHGDRGKISSGKKTKEGHLSDHEEWLELLITLTKRRAQTNTPSASNQAVAKSASLHFTQQTNTTSSSASSRLSFNG